MVLTGKIFVFGDHVNTDEIISARYLNTISGEELAPHLMEDIRPGFGQRDDLGGAVIVAGENFGCGSSREHAPLALKSAGIAAVIARSFSRIFLRNAVNIGLPIVESACSDGFAEGDLGQIDLEKGTIENRSNGRTFSFVPIPLFYGRSWLPADGCPTPKKT